MVIGNNGMNFRLGHIRDQTLLPTSHENETIFDLFLIRNKMSYSLEIGYNEVECIGKMMVQWFFDTNNFILTQSGNNEDSRHEVGW